VELLPFGGVDRPSATSEHAQVVSHRRRVRRGAARDHFDETPERVLQPSQSGADGQQNIAQLPFREQRECHD